MNRTFESQLKKQALNDITNYFKDCKELIKGKIITSDSCLYWYDETGNYQITMYYQDLLENVTPIQVNW